MDSFTPPTLTEMKSLSRFEDRLAMLKDKVYEDLSEDFYAIIEQLELYPTSEAFSLIHDLECLQVAVSDYLAKIKVERGL